MLPSNTLKYSKIEILKRNFNSLEKLTFENCYYSFIDKFLIIQEDNENTRHAKIFDLSDIDSYKITK